MFKTSKAGGLGGRAENCIIPDIPQPVILSGGVYDKNDIDYYLSLGAIAVEVGTVFAASKESCLSDATKQSIIDKGLKDLRRFKSDNRLGLNIQDYNDSGFNHYGSLLKGIKDPTKGHIYAGEAVERITEILSVAEIMKRLTCE
jgi:NAD(P)H-dependent flavin oxidoreductase YrpB (nitropropane dioxygenase family)